MMTKTILCAVGLLSADATMANAEPKVGDVAPELDVAKDESGKPVTLKGVRGKWVVITFGANWCTPCAAELPEWDKLAPTYNAKVQFWAVNVNNDPADGKKFHDKLGLKHLRRVYLPEEQAKADEQYDTGMFPSTFVIDPAGVVRHIHKGFRAGDQAHLRQALDALLIKR